MRGEHRPQGRVGIVLPDEALDAALRHVFTEDRPVEGPVEVESREVGLEIARLLTGDGDQCLLRRIGGCRDQAVGLLRRRHEHRLDREEDLDVGGGAPGGDGGVVDARPVTADARLVERRERQLHVGVVPGERQSAARPARRNDGRLAVGERHGVQRAVEAVVLAAVAGGIQSRSVGVDAGLLVDDEGALSPAAPEIPDAAEPLLGPVVRRVMSELRRGREVSCAARVGHDVQAQAVAAEVLQRRELAGGGVREVRRGVHRGNDPEVPGRREQVRREQEGVVLRAAERVAHAQVDGLGAAERGGVLDDQQVETGLLERAGGVLVQTRLGPAMVPPQVRVAPSVRSEAAREEPAEVLEAGHSTTVSRSRAGTPTSA